MLKLFKIAFVALIICTALPYQAKAYDIPGIETGETFPSFEATDQNGDTHKFEDLYGEKGAVLFYVRSADWCPFCKIQLIDLQNRYKEIEDKGYKVISMSYDPVEKLKQFSDRYKIGFTMLSDPQSGTIKALGILNEEVEKESRAYGVPHPVIYIISKDSKIIERFGEESYKDRPQIDTVLPALD